MKIDKVVFSSSELFAPFWNVQAKVWRELGIEPVCLLWGKIENTDMDPSLGEIIEMEFNPDLFESFQITWSKFYHTLSEPDTTWIIGDMDQIPLRRSRFIDDISDLPDECYTHLAFAEIPFRGQHIFKQIASRNQHLDLTIENVFCALGGFYDGGMDLPAYYHVAKGSVFNKALGLDEKTFDEQVKYVTESKLFGLGPLHDRNDHHPSWDSVKHSYNIPVPEEELYVWVADENYSSHRIWNAHKTGKIKFIPKVSYENADVRLGRHRMSPDGQYVPSTHYSKVTDGHYVDVHCARPYDQQEKALIQLLEAAWPNVKF